MKTKLPLLVGSAALLMSCGPSITISSTNPSTPASSGQEGTSAAPSSEAPEAISSMEEEVTSIVDEIVKGDVATFALTMEQGTFDFSLKNIRRGETRAEDQLVDNYVKATIDNLDYKGSFGGNFETLGDITFLSQASGSISESHLFDLQGKEVHESLDEDSSAVEYSTYSPRLLQDEFKSTPFAFDFGMDQGFVYGDFSDRGVRSIADYAVDSFWDMLELDSGYKSIVSLLVKGILVDPFKADVKKIADNYEEEVEQEIGSEARSVIDEIGGIDLDLTLDDIVDFVLDYLNEEVGIKHSPEGGYLYDLDFDKADVSSFISDLLEALPFDEITPEFIAQIAANLVVPDFNAQIKINKGSIDLDYNIDFTGVVNGNYNPFLTDYTYKDGENYGEVKIAVKAKGNIKLAADEGPLPVVPLDGENVVDATEDIISIIDNIRKAASTDEEEPQ